MSETDFELKLETILIFGTRYFKVAKFNFLTLDLSGIFYKLHAFPAAIKDLV